MVIRRLPALRRGPFLLENNLSRLVDEAFSDFHRIGCDISPSYGRTDVYEKDQALVFETELPGVKKDEIAIKFEDGQLVIKGEVKRNEEIDRENYFRVGRRYGQFQRSFPLPAELIEKDSIKATFEDGILRVTAPMKESIKEEKKPIEILVE
ncbi:Hsp20/alpha crystallin family protein [Candidatus Bipolaricaulota bacterium]